MLHTTSHEKLVYACRAAVSVVRYVYAFRNYFCRVSTAVQYTAKCFVTSCNTSTGLLGTFQASNIGEWHTKKLFRSSSIILATLIFWWEFPFKILCTQHMVEVGGEVVIVVVPVTATVSMRCAVYHNSTVFIWESPTLPSRSSDGRSWCRSLTYVAVASTITMKSCFSKAHIVQVL